MAELAENNHVRLRPRILAVDDMKSNLDLLEDIR
jgi:hypothetical protein